ncbi:MAG: mucoidy inhibitor MuiA family protein [Chitinophagaceae bacterium]|nr:mucoidy inhibitor MuiA family protein [Chitinophagaceae bacterium]
MKKILFSYCLLISITSFCADEKNTVHANLKSATVFKNGAELTHTASSNLKQGMSELVIENIANQIDINSIQIKTANAVTLMGIEFSNNYLAPTEKSPRIKMLEDSIQKLQAERDKLYTATETNNELFQVLKSNRDLKGTQTGMSVTELAKLMDYYKTKMQELQETKSSLTEKMKKIDEQKAKLQNQINEENSKNTSQAGRLILQLSVAILGKYDFTISYIANNAYWTPYYDVRVDDIKSPLKLITKAKITQTTGIDWKQVKLSLSTSLPSQWGNAPILNAWYLAYVNPVYALQGRVAGLAMNSIQQGYLEKSSQKAESSSIRIRGTASINGNNEPLYIVNGAEMSKSEFNKISSSDIKSVNVLKDANATSLYGSRGINGVIVVTLKEGMDDYVTVTDNTLNLAFDIDLPYDVPTNGKAQTATIASNEIAASYKHYAVPKLDNDVYLLAEIPEWEKLNLMPAEANIIFEGTYVGKSFIDPNNTTDTLNFTLGRDKRVVVKRNKLTDYSSVKFWGSNKLQQFTYEITIRNTKKEAINLLLKDQFPLTTNKEIEVELISNGGAEVNNDLGILNWQLNLVPGETKKIRFSYSSKYPKDKQININ